MLVVGTGMPIVYRFLSLNIRQNPRQDRLSAVEGINCLFGFVVNGYELANCDLCLFNYRVVMGNERPITGHLVVSSLSFHIGNDCEWFGIDR